MTIPSDGAARAEREFKQGRWIEINSLKMAPRVPGCYVLILNEKFLYVGSSQDLRGRLRSYGFDPYQGSILSPWGKCRSVRCKIKVTKQYGDWLMDEARLIRRLKPILNKRGSIGRGRIQRRPGGAIEQWDWVRDLSSVDFYHGQVSR